MTTSSGLRELADFLDEHPECDTGVVTLNLHRLSKDALAAFARGGGKVKKVAGESAFWLNRDFASLTVSAFADAREEVCRKVVVGTRVVPERVVPEHEEEIVEWECDPILSGEAVAA